MPEVAPIAPLATEVSLVTKNLYRDLPMSKERLAPAVTGANARPTIPKIPLIAPNDPVVIRVIANSVLETRKHFTTYQFLGYNFLCGQLCHVKKQQILGTL